MRSKLSVLLVLCCLILSCCGQKETQSQVHFYYCRNSVDYKNGIISSEVRNEPVDHPEYKELFSAYLAGPHSKGLKSPYPSGTSLISVTVEDQTAHLVLNDKFAELTGIRLSVACTCLALTVKDVTGCATVEIRAQNALLDSQRTITVDTNAIALTDHVHP